jgi:hypothetical protein
VVLAYRSKAEPSVRIPRSVVVGELDPLAKAPHFYPQHGNVKEAQNTDKASGATTVPLVSATPPTQVYGMLRLGPPVCGRGRCRSSKSAVRSTADRFWASAASFSRWATSADK